MRQADERPIDPEVEAELDAIDATLAGEPVDPRYALVAELALLLAAERPPIAEEFARELDARSRHGFSPPPALPAGGGGSSGSRRMRAWTGLGALAAAAAVAIAVVVGSGSGSPGGSPPYGFEPAHGSSAGSGSAAAVGASAPTAAGSAGSAASAGPARSGVSGNFFGPTPASPAQYPPQLGTPGLRLPANGRKAIASAQLSLTSDPSRIEAVAQEVLDVVGRENGVVERSSVTAQPGAGGYAEISLEVPSTQLTQTMTELSELRFARVESRTDQSTDVNDRYAADVRRLADARVLRTALLRQLSAATTQAAIDSLTAQIHDAEASIASDSATLRGLQGQVSLSQVSVSIQAVAAAPAHHAAGAFGLGRAAHTAARVLVVAAAVGLIVLAALVPVALVGALLAWIGLTTRRRSRERAPDAG